MTRLLQLLVLLTVLLSSLPRSSFAGLGSDRFRAGSFPAAPPPAVAPFDAATARRHQEAWARYLGQPVEHKNGLGQELVPLPPGELLRGSSPEQVRQATEWGDRVRQISPGAERARITGEEQPQHRVLLTRPFRIGKTEVTLGEYSAFVAATGYVTETERFGGGNSSKREEMDPRKRETSWRRPGYATTDRSPVTQLTWNDMVAFCNWLSEQEGRAGAYRKGEAGEWIPIPGAAGYRLPTEAEWEYACRAGTTTHYSFGDDPGLLDRYAWYNENADDRGAEAVGSRLPNPFGLYDMHGNAWERCDDGWEPDAYRKAGEKNPCGPVVATRRVVRGGGWHYFALHARSAYRNNYVLLHRTGSAGFRVVRF